MGDDEAEITCPFCGESTVIVIDPYVSRQKYIEDCTVCCQPIEVYVTCEDGALTSIEVSDGR